MADLSREGGMRSADALLRTNGGRRVLLRMPAPATAGNAAEELGLVTPQFQDVEMEPAVFRKAESTTTLLISATTVDALVGSLAFDSVRVLFETAAGVVVDGDVYAIENVVAGQASGAAFCYALTLRAPSW